MPGHHEETPHCLGMSKVVLWNLQRPFSNPQWTATYPRGCRILSTNRLSMSIWWTRCSIRNIALFQFSTYLCHPLCGSQDQTTGESLGHHITPNRQCPQELGFPATTKIKSNTLYLLTEPASCWGTFHITADLRKNTISEISTTKAGYLVYKEV